MELPANSLVLERQRPGGLVWACALDIEVWVLSESRLYGPCLRGRARSLSPRMTLEIQEFSARLPEREERCSGSRPEGRKLSITAAATTAPHAPHLRVANICRLHDTPAPDFGPRPQTQNPEHALQSSRIGITSHLTSRQLPKTLKHRAREPKTSNKTCTEESGEPDYKMLPI